MHERLLAEDKEINLLMMNNRERIPTTNKSTFEKLLYIKTNEFP